MTDVARHRAYYIRARFGALDGLRFFCIAAVLFHHMPGAHELGERYPFLSRGFLGVDFFFVLSGFLITSLLLREKERTGRISLRGFYWRRALRILPLYLLVVTVMVVVFAGIKADPLAREIWPYYYVFLANFLTGDIANLGPMWSLSVEEQYYTLWPLLVVLLPARLLLPAVGALVVLIMAGVLDVFGIPAPRFEHLKIAIQAGYVAILLGSGLAIVLHSRIGFDWLTPWLGRTWSVLPLVALLVVLLLILPKNLAGWPQFALHVTMALILGALVMREDHIAMPLLRFRPIARIGEVSYGVYLLHLLALHVATESLSYLGQPGDGFVHIGLYLALSWILAEISFRSFERYFLSLRHKRLPIPSLKSTGEPS
ncbi:acyltransferase family protein [Pseudooceanicola nitratireducens]|uniref:acyltransferase family protein n=1 Tax=Pseudooceanicola nitratireducens TaxID=517719 RepID=UPI003C7D05C6